MIAIIDYGVGNLFSLKSSLDAIGADAHVTGIKTEIENADRIILPGVGAFGDAAEKLDKCGIAELIKSQAAKGKPILGICLGMQLLFNKSYEYGKHCGLGLIDGNVRPIEGVIPDGFKIPHIGWNSLKFTDKKSKLFKYINDGNYTHSCRRLSQNSIHIMPPTAIKALPHMPSTAQILRRRQKTAMFSAVSFTRKKAAKRDLKF